MLGRRMTQGLLNYAVTLPFTSNSNLPFPLVQDLLVDVDG
jgi:hypothetical protein